ncbi:MAG: hypothetical protein JXB30_08950 [Anaerolineae bacterium]|nr:hypothetical protein [Anaerolineae bacterium]
MADLPYVVHRSWQRMLLAQLVVWAPTLTAGGWLVFIQGWHPLGASRLITLAVIAFVISILFRLIVGLTARRIFRQVLKAHQLLVQQKYPEALTELHEHLAFLERHVFLDRWRTVLFLDTSKHGVRENTWITIAFTHMRNGDLENGQAAYKQCLEANPHNETAIDTLNFIAAFAGEPLRPGGSGLTFCLAVDPKQNRRQSNIRFVVSMIFIWGLGSTVSSLFTMFGGRVIDLLLLELSWFWRAVVSVFVLYWLIGVLMKIYHWAATRMVLLDLYRANWLVKTRRYQEAVKALEVQRAFFDEHPWVDNLRWLLLLSPTTYSYREWILISLADVYLDLGDVDEYINYNQECLVQNPKNAFARSRLEFCNTILGSLNKPLIQIPIEQV